jgi:hypothetical protein
MSWSTRVELDIDLELIGSDVIILYEYFAIKKYFRKRRWALKKWNGAYTFLFERQPVFS